MNLYFAGSEQPIYARKLYALGVRHMAISFFEWRRRHSADDLYKHLPEDVKVCVIAGIARKEELDFQAFATDYIEFCEANAEQALIYGMDTSFCPLKIQHLVRNQLSVLPNVVTFPIGDEEPKELTAEYERIGINASLGKSLPTNELRRLQATLYGSNITDPRKLRDGRFAATTSSAWLGPMKFGELWIFSNNQLRHYKADQLKRAVQANVLHIEAYGVDPKACAANDRDALTELAVISLQHMAESLTKRRRDNQNVEAAAASPIAAQANVANDSDSVRVGSGSQITPVALTRRETSVLPIISVNDLDGVRKVRLNGDSLRTCDSCNLSEVCPGYEAQSTCKYSVPVEIKTKEQWEAAAQVLLEAQFQRTMHGAFAEQTDGGDLTPRVGQEMDRFFKMLSSIKELETAPDTSAAGPMTRFFQAANQLGAPNSGEDSEDEDDAIEGEVLSEEGPEGDDYGDAA